MPLKVVYIDDEEDICEMFEDLFANEAVQVKVFTDPLAGIEAIEKDPPDLIFLDYRLPGTTGDQIAAKIDSNIPKALVTGDSNVELIQSFIRVFEKPLKVEQIEDFIQSYL